MTDYNTPQLAQAEYIVQFSDGNATVLCDTHMTALRMAAAAALQPIDIYAVPDDEDAIVCQACHLAEMQRPRIVLPH
jgi:hypothetical protein